MSSSQSPLGPLLQLPQTHQRQLHNLLHQPLLHRPPKNPNLHLLNLRPRHPFLLPLTPTKPRRTPTPHPRIRHPIPQPHRPLNRLRPNKIRIRIPHPRSLQTRPARLNHPPRLHNRRPHLRHRPNRRLPPTHAKRQHPTILPPRPRPQHHKPSPSLPLRENRRRSLLAHTTYRRTSGTGDAAPTTPLQRFPLHTLKLRLPMSARQLRGLEKEIGRVCRWPLSRFSIFSSSYRWYGYGH